MNNKYFAYNLISKYRNVLMGTAIIMIMFCHFDVAQIHNNVPVTRFASLMQTFTVGVDIFVFLSGFGLYYSCAKKPVSYFAFEKKRILRVLPLYIIIAGITYFVDDVLLRHLGIFKFLRDLSFISWPKEGSTRYWYILAIVLFYLIFPILFHIVQSKKCSITWIIVGCIFWFAFFQTLCFKVPLISTFRIAISRFPIFALGTYCGKCSFQNKSTKFIFIPILIGPAALIVLKKCIPDPYYSYLYYPIRGLLALSIITFTICAMKLLDKKLPKFASFIEKFIGWFGGLTLELYLLHQSYLILFEYPYKLSIYPLVAFLLPVITAFLFYFIKQKIKKGENHEHLQHI